MRMYRAAVVATTSLSPHLTRVTLGGAGLNDFPTTGMPDEYVRLQLPNPGAALVVPEISDAYEITYPEGVAQPDARVYTVSDHRVGEFGTEVDIDIALHAVGAGSAWARSVAVGDEVAINDAYGLYAASPTATWQLLVCDLTGVPALARILRGLTVAHTARVTVVITDAADVLDLPSVGNVTIDWVVVDHEHDIPEALERAVRAADLPADQRFVWLAGEARASRAVRRYLRRELGWPQTDFYTCGYWQIEAEKWNARYKEVADVVNAKATVAYERLAEDEGAYLDALDDIYDEAGL
ncbi:MAG: NADPH-dependent ferric siderophore reductase [Nocardioidaceae bacterium]|nr:NADPH-dependent ferric siderophore reductase [Nocardioidaceae bacterium]